MQPDAQSNGPDELQVGAAATILGTSRDTVYRLIHEGLLGYRCVGLPSSRRPTYRVLANDVYALREQHQRKQTERPSRHRKSTKRVSTDDLRFIRLAPPKSFSFLVCAMLATASSLGI